MINGINNNDNNELINARLNGQNGVGNVVTNPIGNTNPYVKDAKYNFNDISAISNDAYYLYQRDQDIKQFNEIALSGMDDKSYIAEVENLFKQGVTDPFVFDMAMDTEDLADYLASNEEFLNDIEFNML
ncbi:hypothetical protein IKE67_07365 [bacterium]|nr:hypothetical protein [bacterium]